MSEGTGKCFFWRSKGEAGVTTRIAAQQQRHGGALRIPPERGAGTLVVGPRRGGE